MYFNRRFNDCTGDLIKGSCHDFPHSASTAPQRETFLSAAKYSGKSTPQSNWLPVGGLGTIMLALNWQHYFVIDLVSVPHSWEFPIKSNSLDRRTFLQSAAAAGAALSLGAANRTA